MPAHDDEKLGPWRIVAAIILALLAIAFIVVGVALSGDHHSLRMIGSVLVGIAFALGSWFALRYRSLALEEAEQAALAEAERTAAAGEQAPPSAQAGQRPTTAATQA